MAQCRQRLRVSRHLALGTNKVWRTNQSVFDTHAAEHQSKNRHLSPKVCFICHFSLVDHFSLPTRFLHSSHYYHHRDISVIFILFPSVSLSFIYRSPG
jgi:hypothetical protein